MEQLANAAYWEVLLQKSLEWSISTFPSVIIILILWFVTFRVFRFSMNKIKNVIISRAIDEDDTEREKRVNTLIGILGGAGRVAIWLIFVVILLGKVGIDIGPILAGAGIVGLAVGFGAQELVRDVISGFFMILENQVRTGDVAIINGTGGVVERLELRTITLRDFSQVVHIFQNGKINSLSNMTKDWSAMAFDIGVAYKEDTDRVIQIMKEVGDDLQKDPDFEEKIIEPIEVLGLDQFGDSAIVIKARIKTKPIEQWTVGREYRKRLKVAFDKNGIEIPFPHRTIYWGEDISPLKLSQDKG